MYHSCVVITHPLTPLREVKYSTLPPPFLPFSLPFFLSVFPPHRQSFHRHHQRALQHTLDGCEGDMTKTPEESVCSIEGPSVLSVYADGPSDMGTPSILHRSYKL